MTRRMFFLVAVVSALPAAAGALILSAQSSEPVDLDAVATFEPQASMLEFQALSLGPQAISWTSPLSRSSSSR